MPNPLRILIAGCGHMGTSHARAYHKMDGFEIVGLVSRGEASRKKLNDEFGGQYAEFGDYQEALDATRPDCVSINTYPDTHAAYALAAIGAGCHVFMEKPVAETVEECAKVVEAAKAAGKKLVVGYILHVHPSWQKFVEVTQTLGKPLVMRMNLNQQSSGANWGTHKNLLASMSPIVDCGVHYVDVMCRMTGARPIRVSAIGARLSDEISPNQVNYGQLQVTFDDGSVGWYEAGWGPMMSETAFFVKDIISANGSVSITDGDKSKSDDVDGHTAVGGLLVHRTTGDQLIDLPDEPGHQELCDAEQAYMLRAITEDIDLTRHMNDAVQSLRICLAADESIRTGNAIDLTKGLT
jgi:predicted dehydrogenase